jgi:hypothetical protein
MLALAPRRRSWLLPKPPFVSTLGRLEDRGGELGGGHHPQRAVRPVVVVLLAPVLDQHLGFGQAGEQLDGQQLVADAGAEALE